jgi:hypothetical protein
MSVAFFIATETETDGLDTFVNGKAIAKVSDKALKKVCAAAGVKSVYDYVSMDPDELGEFLEDEDVEKPESLPPEQWFPAEEGLNWATKLAEYLRANPTVIKGSPEVLADLAEYEAVFKGLQARGVRWHFQVDF